MKQSLGFFPTIKELPKDAECKSHILMLRAGLIRQLAAGLYTYLPMGRRALKKVEEIMRQEMDRAGAIEVLMPSLQPDTLWKASGRWDVMGPELMRLQDRAERNFVLGPTHEEVITTLAANEIRSYRDLPKNIYQIQTKFRDEVRPRFGVIRSREFIMKDGYSFDCDMEGARRSYEIMVQAYKDAFKRCGLDTIAVEADTGAMGGSHSHEFMVLADIGEAEIVICKESGYQANRELAVAPEPEAVAVPSGTPPMEDVHTPNLKTIEEVSAFMNAAPQQMIKTMIYTDGEKPFVVLLRGDHTVNEVKLAKARKKPVTLAEPEVIVKVTGAPVGFAGPVGLNGYEIWADHSIKTISVGITGANKGDYHKTNVVLECDYKVDQWGDFRLVEEGDPCPISGKPVAIKCGIEVGHVFVLGTKYSDALNAYYTSESGERKPMVMGCFGIGVSRTLASVIEVNNDENGIIWPISVAPYHVHILVLSTKSAAVISAAEKLYDDFTAQGLDVLMDERDERPGIKFKDADLFGIPYRVVVGEKSLNEGNVEFLRRRDLDKKLASPQECFDTINQWYQSDMDALKP